MGSWIETRDPSQENGSPSQFGCSNVSDNISFHVFQMLNRVEIDCSQGNTWEALLEATILKGWDADLINFDMRSHGPICIRLAERWKVEFIPNPMTRNASVRHTI